MNVMRKYSAEPQTICTYFIIINRKIKASCNCWIRLGINFHCGRLKFREINSAVSVEWKITPENVKSFS